MSAKRESAKRDKGKSATKKLDSIKLFSFILLFILGVLGYPGKLPAELSPAQKFTLGNGMVVIIKELPGEMLVTVGAFVRAGSSAEDKFLGSGISHFTEHMLFKGTASRGVGEIGTEIKSLGGKMDGFTSFDYTGYRITIPAQYLDQAVEVIGDSLLNPSIDPEEVNKERNVILKEINLNRDTPSRYLSNLLWSNAYAVHPYRYPVIGERALFARLTQDDIIEYYRKMYVPRNVVIVVVGNVDTEKALAKIKSTFKDFSSPFSSPFSLLLPSEPRQVAAKKIIKEADVKSVYFNLAFHSVELANRDLYALDLLAAVLGKGESSRFNRILSAEKKLVDTIDVFNWTPRYPGLFVVSGTTGEENLNQAVETVFAEIEKVKKGAISQRELNKAKSQLKADYFYRQERLEDQANDLGLNELLAGDFNFSKVYIEAIDLVTLKDTQRVAKQYLTKSNSITCVLTPSLDRVDAREERKKSAAPILKKTLNNGLVVLLKEEHNLPLVSIVAAFRGGVRAEEEANNGISYLTAQSLCLAVRGRNGEGIFESIEAMGGKLSSFSGNNSFGLSLSLPSSNLEQGLELLGDILINHRFSGKKIERERKKMLAELKREEDDVFSRGFRILKTNLFPQHPYRLHYLGTEESLTKLSAEDVTNFSNRFVTPDNMVLSVFGDVHRDKILAKIDNVFGRMKQREFEAVVLKDQPGLKTTLNFTGYLNKEQALIVLGFPAVSVYDQDRYTLELISSILSGAGGRLYKRIRDELGLAYTLGAFLVSGVDPGYYVVYVATTPGNLKEVKREILREISRLKKEMINEQELKVAQAGLIGRQMISLQGNSSLAVKASLDELYGLGFDDYTRYSDKINKITAGEIKRVADKYFKLDAYVTVILTQNKF